MMKYKVGSVFRLSGMNPSPWSETFLIVEIFPDRFRCIRVHTDGFGASRLPKYQILYKEMISNFNMGMIVQ